MPHDKWRDVLRERIVKIAQREVEDSITPHGSIAYLEFLGARIAAEVTEMIADSIAVRWEVSGTNPEWGDDTWTIYPESREQALEWEAEAKAKPGVTAQARFSFELRTMSWPLRGGENDDR